MPSQDFLKLDAQMLEDGYTKDDITRMKEWMEANKDEVSKADRIISNIDTQFVSIVDHPAVTDSVLMFKSLRAKDDDKLKTKFVSFIKGKPQTKGPSYKKGSIFGAVLQPDITDGNGEILPPWESVKTAHKWMEEYQQIDNQHSFEETKDAVVESWVPETETEWKMDNGQTKTYPAYTWFMIVKPTENTKQKIINGEFTGFSIAGKWAFMDTKGKKQETVQDVSTMKANLEKALLDMIKTFEVETGVAVDYVTVDRGNWGENESFENHIKKPISKIMINALVKSRSSSDKERSSEEVKDMEPEEVKEMIKEALAEYEKSKGEEQSQKNAEEELTKMKDDITSIKESIEKLSKSEEEVKEDEESEKAEDEDEEEDEKADAAEEEEEEMEDEKADDEEDDDSEVDEEKQLKHKAETKDPKKKSKDKGEVKTPEEEIDEYVKQCQTDEKLQVKRLGLYKEE